jgi:hypothetical protein
MADVTELKTMLDAYGIGVRAGVLTPCLQDENTIRAMFGLGEAPDEVVKAWEDRGGVRQPITLQKETTDDGTGQPEDAAL